jgi:hypothetical protein
MFWLFEKYKEFIVQTNITSKSFRLIELPRHTKCELAKENDYNCLIDWTVIDPHYSFFFDYEGCEFDITTKMRNSELHLTDSLFVETTSSNNIIKVPTEIFILNWYDFIIANQGFGSIVVSTDFKYCMEFTDDFKYFLFSNFKIN